MADKTKIEWTDATWNVITGCSVKSPGCTNCYAMRLAGTRMRSHPTRKGLTIDTKTGPVWNGEVRFNESMLAQPLQWTKPRMIFVCAHADLFHENVPDEWIDKVFAVMALCPQHTFQVLTKRSARMRAYLHAADVRVRIGALIPGLSRSWRQNARGIWHSENWPLSNMWLGVSVEDQKRADERIPDLLATPAVVRWLSMEPLLGPVDLTSVKAPGDGDETDGLDWRFDALEVGDYYWFDGEDGQIGDSGDGPYRDHRIDWVVAGGESGPGARPMHPDWARSLRDQCADATIHGDPAPVPFHFKQWGDWAPGECCEHVQTRTETGAHWFDERWSYEEITPRVSEELHTDDAPDVWRIGKKRAGRMLDGVQHDGMPHNTAILDGPWLEGPPR